MTEAPRTVRDLVTLGRGFLERKGVEAARLEAELLVAHALGRERLQVFLELDRPVEPAEVDRARELLVRRGKGEPCAYLVGKREFYGRDFAVGPGVLVPRPETELLVDLGRECLAGRAAPRVLDVGTGSGCLALTLALEVDGAHVAATERSAEALAWAERNRERLLGADDGDARVELLAGDGWEPVRGRRFDLVVANPPYVRPEDRDALEPAVRAHEPAQALFAPAGEPDHWVRRLVGARAELLEPDGTLLVELGHDQAPTVEAWLEAEGVGYRLHADLAGVPRVLEVGARVAPPALDDVIPSGGGATDAAASTGPAQKGVSST